MAVQTTISPIEGSAVATRELPTNEQLNAAVEKAWSAQKSWAKVPIDERISIVNKFLDLFEQHKDEYAKQLTEEMGRPIKFAAGEMKGFMERARFMVSIAKDRLKDVSLVESDKEGFKRWIRREPVGVCALISAWNFPYMIQVNALIPALLAGNSVILKPSPQTPSPADNMTSLLLQAGLPEGVCQALHLSLEQMDLLVAHRKVNFVSFTGSVKNGYRVEENARGSKTGMFKNVNLELGGKDPAYVREDCDPKFAAEEIADGGYFNSGQSCCAVERVYVHESIYEPFVEELVKTVSSLNLADPRTQESTLGPVISKASAEAIRSQVSEAISQGAKAMVPEDKFANIAKEGSTYVAPQVLVNVNHSMRVMKDETFGPVVGVMKVKNDEEALELMNDSPYGLTASVWTNDKAAFDKLLPDIEAGTVFMNRCDYLDPALAWTGVKESGRGVSLSAIGYDQVTRAKSVHTKIVG
ncbi:succinate semialdehyde dehydrogenase [Cystobasidium minutum MCA 4210]|uniref:succinate semialdehyde dehydrogenase n=1 Tax=Cystobasidium minutum MCA 4210 TaxID=1397322 RepID=UPI0034CD6E8F|eukprot:jgi/Rhomi1/22117/CE22116_1336